MIGKNTTISRLDRLVMEIGITPTAVIEGVLIWKLDARTEIEVSVTGSNWFAFIGTSVDSPSTASMAFFSINEDDYGEIEAIEKVSEWVIKQIDEFRRG